MLDLNRITCPSAGVLSRLKNGFEIENDSKLESYPTPELDRVTDRKPQTSLPAPQTTRNHLIRLYTAQRPLHVVDDGFVLYQEIRDGFEAVINFLYNLGFQLDKDFFPFCRFDLQTQNLVARVTSAITITITGIIDWDSAAFAPKSMSICVPFSAWMEDGNAWEEDEIEGNRPLIDPEQIVLKTVYEDIAGPGFAQTSYAPELAFTRRMLYCLMRDLTNGGEVLMAKELIEDFAKLEIK